jgi:hypothetical protein
VAERCYEHSTRPFRPDARWLARVVAHLCARGSVHHALSQHLRTMHDASPSPHWPTGEAHLYGSPQ